MMRSAMISAAVLLMCACQAADGPPRTRKRPVSDTYFGTTVTDDYRWLEDWSDPEVRSWSDAQNAYARGMLETLPGVGDIRERVAEILEADSVEYTDLRWTGREYLAIKRQPPRRQPFLVAFESPDRLETERVVIDPNEIDRSGATSIDWYVPSPDGSLVAVSLSRGGSELGDLQLVRTATGEPTGETIDRVNAGTAGGDLAWSADGRGFFYTRYPRPGERPEEDLIFHQEVWFHRLGTLPDHDVYELGREMPRIAEFRLEAHHPSGRVLATYQFGDSGHFEIHLRDTDGTWARVSEMADAVVQATFGHDGSVLLVSRLDAPRGKLLRLPPGVSDIDRAVVLVGESDDTVVFDFYGSSPIVITSDRLFVTYQVGGPSTIRAFDTAGRPQPGPNVPPVSGVGSLAVGREDTLLFSTVSYLEPRTWRRFDPVTGETTTASISTTSPVDFSDAEAVREHATSKDGTRVPVTVVRRRGGPIDGERPTLLTGYGGFNVSVTPRFQPLWRIWLDHGGVLAVANLRGGGEFGEEWHRGGMLTRKQNVFDDFAAAARLLIDLGYTRPGRLAIRGGSNGGLLMGATLTQHPDLVRAVVSHVGIYDMLRVELSANGAFNTPEYGTVKDPKQFAAMFAYSPYHNVEDGTDYPAVLLTTGANDPRVDPMQSRKMAARLQAASTSGLPILLRTSSNTGHGMSTPLDERIEQEADVLAFLFHELGVDPGPKP